MNANEVIGHLAGSHPNDEVNRGQSSNDVIPTALHMATVETVQCQLLPAMRNLHGALEAKSREFDDVSRSPYASSGRRPYAAGAGVFGIRAAGGSGTGARGGGPTGPVRTGPWRHCGWHGLNAPAGFAAAVIAELAVRTGLPLREASNHFEAQGARDAAAFLIRRAEKLRAVARQDCQRHTLARLGTALRHW